jgi:UDP-4-amino-4,6-dideoxy-N-acetyl-beta-L-altrosamine N-acetyltransferase
MSEVAAPPATRLRLATDADATRILVWRNHSAVRRVMFTDHVISIEEHTRWWQRVRASNDHQVLVVEHRDRACGVVTFTRLDPSDDDGDPVCDTWTWGFYLDPEAFAPGADALRAWSGMEQASLQYAAAVLHAHRIDCEVFAFNAAVLALHKRHGFIEVGRYERTRGDDRFEVVRLTRRAD